MTRRRIRRRSEPARHKQSRGGTLRGPAPPLLFGRVGIVGHGGRGISCAASARRQAGWGRRAAGVYMQEEDVIYGDTFAVRHLWGMKRRHPRYDLIVPVRVAFGSGSDVWIVTGLTRDVALGGMGFLSAAPLGLPERDVVTL